MFEYPLGACVFNSHKLNILLKWTSGKAKQHLGGCFGKSKPNDDFQWWTHRVQAALEKLNECFKKDLVCLWCVRWCHTTNLIFFIIEQFLYLYILIETFCLTFCAFRAFFWKIVAVCHGLGYTTCNCTYLQRWKISCTVCFHRTRVESLSEIAVIILNFQVVIYRKTVFSWARKEKSITQVRGKTEVYVRAGQCFCFVFRLEPNKQLPRFPVIYSFHQ